MRTIICTFAVAAIFCLTCGGCATTEKVAESLAEKDVAGSGFLSIQRIGVDPETKIPALKSTVISGDFQTIKAGTTYLNYKDEESSAWYSSSITNRRRTLTISLDGDASLTDVLGACSAAFDKVPRSDAAPEAAPSTASE